MLKKKLHKNTQSGKYKNKNIVTKIHHAYRDKDTRDHGDKNSTTLCLPGTKNEGNEPNCVLEGKK